MCRKAQFSSNQENESHRSTHQQTFQVDGQTSGFGSCPPASSGGFPSSSPRPATCLRRRSGKFGMNVKVFVGSLFVTNGCGPSGSQPDSSRNSEHKAEEKSPDTLQCPDSGALLASAL
ncbi:unnamed protein product [Lampetra planeri]